MPRITVAIPAYRPRFLGQAIASVLAQTFDDYELLISDDCPDGSVRGVVARFSDPRIRVLEGPRAGLVPNSVHLWDNARTDLLKYVYDDDFLLPFALETLRRVLEQEPQAGYAFGHRHLVDDAGRITSSPRAIKGEQAVKLTPGVIPAAILRGLRNMVGEPTNVLIRRSAFESAACLSCFAGYPIRHMIDVAFYLNAGARGPCVGVPEFVAAFRQHPESVSGRRDAPAFAIGFIEWELFMRGSVEMGLAPPQAAAEGLPRLKQAYSALAPRYPEVEPFLSGLPDLLARLRAGETRLLDTAFSAAWDAAQALADARLGAA